MFSPKHFKEKIEAAAERLKREKEVKAEALAPGQIYDLFECRKRVRLELNGEKERGLRAVQAAVEKALTTLLGLPAEERTKECADELLAGSSLEEEEAMEKAKACLETYFEMEDPKAVFQEPRYLSKRVGDQEVAAKIGRVDLRFDESGRAVATIVMYCAGKAPSLREEYVAQVQAWLLQQECEGATVDLAYYCLGSGKKVVKELVVDEERLKREVLLAGEELCYRLEKGLPFPARPGITRCCACPFKESCEEGKFLECPEDLAADEIVEELILEASSRQEDERKSTEGVTTVSTPEEAEKVLEILMSLKGPQRFHAIDTETRGWKPGLCKYGNGEIVCFSVYCGDDVDFGSGPRLFVDNMTKQGELTGVLECFRGYLEDPSIKKVFHNYSFDCAQFWNAGIEVKGFAGDTMHMARLEHSDRQSYSLEALGEAIIGQGWGKQSLKKLMKKVGATTPEALHMSEEEGVREGWVEYSTFDTVATWKLHEQLKQRLQQRPWHPPDLEERAGSLYDFYEQCWGPFGHVLARMERRGVPLDVANIEKMQLKAIEDREKELSAFKAWVAREYRARYGDDAELLQELLEGLEAFMISSPKQLTALLLGEGVEQVGKVKVGGLGLPEELITERTPKGAPSLSGPSLKRLAKKVGPYLGEEGEKGIGHLVKIKKEIDKTLTSFLTKLPKWAQNGRLHASFGLHTSTGRLSCSEPNLQQLPALDKDHYGIRHSVRCGEGKRFIVADYGQLDIRVMAHLSKCWPMIASLNSGVDFHSQTAYNMFNKVSEAVDSGKVVLEHKEGDDESIPLVKDEFATERRHAKAVNFGIAYGLTAIGLAKQLGCPLKDAEQTIGKWYEAHQEVQNWQNRIVREAQESGSLAVCTLRGRERRIENLKLYVPEGQESWRTSQRSFQQRMLGGGAFRMAINAPVQGGSADIVVEAMIKAHRCKELKELGYSMILQVHDELVFEGPEENAEKAREVVQELMENPFLDGAQLEVALPVDVHVTKTWGEAKG